MAIKNISNIKTLKLSKGFSAIELVIVIAVGLIVTAIGANYAFKGQKSASVDEDNKLAMEITRCIKDSRTGVSYAGLDLETVIGTRCLDDLGVVNEDRDEVINPYSGAITIDVVEFNGNDDQGVEITSDGYSQEQCVQAAKNRIRFSPIVEINGDEIKTLDDTNVATADITDACSEDSNEIVIVVSR